MAKTGAERVGNGGGLEESLPPIDVPSVPNSQNHDQMFVTSYLIDCPTWELSGKDNHLRCVESN